MSHIQPPFAPSPSDGPSEAPASSAPTAAAGEQNVPARRRLENVTDFLKSLNGLLTAFCAILTLVASLFGLKAHQQASELSAQQVHITVQAGQIEQQQAQIKSLGAQVSQAAVAAQSPTDPPTGTPTGTDTANGGAAPPPTTGQTEYLSAVNPVNGNYDFYGTEPVLLSAVSYANSVRFQCSSSYESTATYPISGFRQMTVTIGVPDNASSATGAKLTVSFTDQDSHKLGSTTTVSIDHSQQVTIPLTGEAQITVHCTATYPPSQSGTTTLALGNAELTQ